ncbi:MULTISPECIES: YxlC family protein [Bacillus]|uniref:YxlC family protein n=1 Tax=Bacillus TaxID=1386 RepID=UPI000BB8A868|nr:MULTISPECIES: YxlC family protein [Bacillus]
MNKKPDQDTLTKLKADWENVDALSEKHLLPTHSVKEQFQLYKQARQKAFQRELMLFIATAITLLTIFILIALKAPIVVLFIWAGSILIAPIIFFYLSRSKNSLEGDLL